MSSARMRLTGALLALTPLLMQSGHLVTKAKADTGDNVVLVWDENTLQGVRDNGGQGSVAKLSPPAISRVLLEVDEAMYDAWAAYDEKALGSLLGGTLRRPESERTEANKIEAISFAAYRMLMDLMPATQPLYDATMAGLGFDPNDTTTDVTTPQGIGNVVSSAIINARHHDGANQLGDLHSPPYSDYTGYVSPNEVMDVNKPIDLSTVHDPNAWQPLKFVDSTGKTVAPKPIGMFWNHVTPFAMTTDGEFRSPIGPAKYGSVQYLKQALEDILVQSTLTDEQKMIVQYWSDGPGGEQPPGHWHLIAEFVSRRDHNTLDQDVKLFFALSGAVFDAGIVAWDNKDVTASERPITAIRYLFHGIPIPSWGGPGAGTILQDGASWKAYFPSWFPTPPFPEYSSGHSNFSAAGAEILKRFTGSDTYGGSVTFAPGTSIIEPGFAPTAPVTLSWATFSDAANQSGMSRRYGGIHFEQGDLDARATGRLAAELAWHKAENLWNGVG